MRGERFKLIRNHTKDVPLVSSRVIRNWQGMDVDTLRQPYPLPRPDRELFDLAADPLESRNLADDPAYSEQLAYLEGELEQWSALPRQ